MLDMSAGIPCERIFKNVFSALKPEAIEKSPQQMSSLLRERISGEVVCFDGQTSCGTADKHKDLRGIHLLKAWSANNKICLAQLKTINTQKFTVKKAAQAEAEYAFPVKENQETLFKDIELAFQDLDQEQKKEIENV